MNDAKHFCKLILRYSFGVQLADLVYLIPSQFVLWILFCMVVFLCGTSFTVTIPIVVTKSSEEQMIRPNAGWSVAVMQHTQAFRDRPTVNNPRDSVRVIISGSGMAATKFTVPLNGVSDPQPTALIVGQDKYLVPESFDDGFGKTLLCEVLRSYRDHAFSSCSVSLTGAAELLFCSKLQMNFQALGVS